MLYGFKIILNDRFDAELIPNHINQYKVTMISLVPTMLSRILKLDFDQNIITSLRSIIIGGSGCSDDLLKKAISRNLPIYKSYGMTESCSGIAGFWVENHSDKISTSGVPIKVSLNGTSSYKVMHSVLSDDNLWPITFSIRFEFL